MGFTIDTAVKGSKTKVVITNRRGQTFRVNRPLADVVHNLKLLHDNVDKGMYVSDADYARSTGLTHKDQRYVEARKFEKFVGLDIATMF